ncbi:MAG: hypothetical protein V8R10_09320 [Christensenellales bacterium]
MAIGCAIGWTNGCAIAWVNAGVIRIVTGIVTDFGAISVAISVIISGRIGIITGIVTDFGVISGAIGCAVSTDFTRIVTLNSAFSVANGEVMQAVRGRRALLFAGNVLQKPSFAERSSSVGEGGGAHGKVGEQVRIVDAEEAVAPVAAAGVLVHDFNQLVPQQLSAGGKAGSRGECVETTDFNQVVYIAHLGHSFRILFAAIATVIL